MALFWALVGKSSTISKYYCHKLWKFALLLTTALILSVKTVTQLTGICVRSTTSTLKSTPIMTAGHGDISVQGFVAAQKDHVRFCRSTCTTWWTKRATLLVLQPLQLFQICPLLSMEWIWTCGLAHHHHYFWRSVRSISGALNEHYLKFWALNRALNAKKQGTLKALLNPNFTSTKLSALVYKLQERIRMI